MKRFLRIILLVLVVCIILSIVADAQPACTLIDSPEGLYNIRNNMSGKYLLMNDIDMSGWGNWEPLAFE